MSKHTTRVLAPSPVRVTLAPGTLDSAREAGAGIVRLATPLSIPLALSLVRESLPPAVGDVRGWAIAVPGGAFVPLRFRCGFKVRDLRVERGALVFLNYAWKTASGRVVLRCHAGPTADRPDVFPIDGYEEQIESIAGLAGKPLEFPGWELVQHDPEAFRLKADS